MMRFLLVVILLLHILCSTNLCAQDFAELRFQHLTTKDNLANPNLTSIHQDKSGLLWIGTENGLTRFDGIDMHTYIHREEDTQSLVANYIVNIIEDSEGDLWIGTQNGLSKYYRKGDYFINYKKFQSDQPIAPNFYAYPFFIDHHSRLWSYFSGYIFQVNLNDNTARYVSNYANGRLFTPDTFYGSLNEIFSNSDVGMFHLTVKGDSVWKRQVYFRKGDKNSLEATIYHVEFNSDSSILIAADKGLILLNPLTKEFQIFDQYKDQKLFVNHLCASPFDSNLYYLATKQHGILIFDVSKQQFLHQYAHVTNDQQSLAGNNVQKIHIDKQGNLFAIIAEKGLDYTNINTLPFHHYLRNSEPEYKNTNNIISILANEQHYIIGVENDGVRLLDKHTLSFKAHFLEGVHISKVLKIDDNKLLILTQDYTPYILTNVIGKYKLSQLSWNKPLPLSNFIIEDIKQVGHEIFIASSYGLYRINVQGSIVHLQAVSSINQSVEWPYFQYIYPINDSSYLLQAFYTNIYLVEGSEVIQIGRTPFKTHDYLIDDNDVLIATTDGLWKYNIADKKLLKDHIVSEYLNAITKDAQGDIWISTANGLLQYKRKHQVINRFTEQDGLQHYLFNKGVMLSFGDTILTAGPNGLNIFKAGEIMPLQRTYDALITAFSVNEKVYHGINAMYLEEIHLPYDSNNLELVISPLTFQLAEDQAIHYQLNGIDPRPIMVKGRNTIRYPQLPPGSYRLKVKGTSDKVRSIIIHIEPAVWQTWWFKLGIILAIITAIWGIWRLRMNHQRMRQIEKVKLMIASQEEERRRIARDLHDDFGARLSTLKLYMHYTDKYGVAIQDATSLIDGAITELRNILFNLSPKVLDENGLKAALIEIANNLNRLKIIQCELDVHHFNRRFPVSTEFSLYRITQELINNTLKYAAATNINIALVERNDSIVYIYEDNGKGFDIDTVSKGYGWNNIHIHSKAINAECFFDTAPNRGFVLTITIPINNQ